MRALPVRLRVPCHGGRVVAGRHADGVVVHPLQRDAAHLEEHVVGRQRALPGACASTGSGFRAWELNTFDTCVESSWKSLYMHVI